MPTGLAFPIRLDNLKGSLKLSSGNQRIQEQIIEIISTNFLERVMRPAFGNENYIFSAIADPSIVSSKIKFSLDTYLTANIETTVSTKVFKDGKMEINIDWLDRNNVKINGKVRIER